MPGLDPAIVLVPLAWRGPHGGPDPGMTKKSGARNPARPAFSGGLELRAGSSQVAPAMQDQPLPEIPPGYDPLSQEVPSGMQELVGYRITVWRQDYAEMELDIEPKHRNRSGRVHGGIFATMIDTVAGHAGCYCPYPGRVRKAVTLTLTTNYLGQSDGAKLIATARRTGGGSTIFYTEAEVRDEHGTLLATGVGTFRYRTGSRTPEGQPFEPPGD